MISLCDDQEKNIINPCVCVCVGRGQHWIYYSLVPTVSLTEPWLTSLSREASKVAPRICLSLPDTPPLSTDITDMYHYIQLGI